MSVSTVSATGIQDPTGQVFANGTWRLEFVPTYGTPGIYNDGGSPFTKQYGGSLDATGSFSQAGVNRNDTIAPAGSQWRFTAIPAVNGTTYSVLLNVNSPAFDVTASINAVITNIVVSPTSISRAYKDSELVNIDGSGGLYYDETLKVLKVWDAVTSTFLPITPNAGSPTFNNLTVTGQALVKNFENIRFADQFPGADLGAKINAAVADIGSGNPGTIIIPDGGGTLSTLVTLGKQHCLIFGAGTYTHVGIRLPDSTIDTTGVSCIKGQGPGKTILSLANTSAVDSISSINFGTLTGTANQFGVFHVLISNLTIDGNKANNASGFGIRLYGRGVSIENVIVQNAKQDGIWAEFGATQLFTDSSWDFEWFITNTRTIYNGGNGYTNKVSDTHISALVAQENGGWGVETFQSLFGSYINLYLNVSGAMHVASGGSINVSHSEFTNSTNWGLLLDTGSGASVCSGCFIGGGGGAIPIALEIRNQGNHIDGFISGGSTAAIKFNDAAAVSNYISATLFSNAGAQLIFTTGGADSTIILSGSAPNAATLNSGAIPASCNLFANITRGVGNLTANQFSSSQSSFTLSFGFPQVFWTAGLTRMGSSQIAGWSSNADATANISDVNITRQAAGILQVGTGETANAGGQAALTALRILEAAPTAGAASSDILYADSTAHRLKMNNNNAGVKTIAALEGDTFTTPIINSGMQFNGATSGATNLTPQPIAGSTSLLLPAATGTLLATGNGASPVQTKRVTTGSVGAGVRVDVTVTWTTAFADANYTPVATMLDTSAAGTGLVVERIRSVVAGSIVVQVINNSGGALTGTVQAMAVHD